MGVLLTEDMLWSNRVVTRVLVCRTDPHLTSFSLGQARGRSAWLTLIAYQSRWRTLL